MALRFTPDVAGLLVLLPRSGQGWKMERETNHWCVYAAVACVYLLIRHAVLGRLTALAQPSESLLQCIRRRPGPVRRARTRQALLPGSLVSDAFRSFDIKNAVSIPPWAWLTLSVFPWRGGPAPPRPPAGFSADLVGGGVAAGPRYTPAQFPAGCRPLFLSPFRRVVPGDFLPVLCEAGALDTPGDAERTRRACSTCLPVLFLDAPEACPGHPGLAQR